jgi:hypothetical protein
MKKLLEDLVAECSRAKVSVTTEAKSYFSDLCDRSHRGLVDVKDCIVRLFFSPTIVSKLLGVERFAKPEDVALSESAQETELKQLVECSLGDAVSRGHGVLCSAHTGVILLDGWKTEAGDVLSRLQSLYRADRPRGSRRQQKLVDLARRLGQDNWREQVEHEILETPLCRDSVRRDLEAFLGSSYYPYGSTDYAQFKNTEGEVSTLRNFAVAASAF